MRQDRRWREAGIDLEMGFNLSPRQFWQPDLAERILHRLEVEHADPGRVVVEITESSAMRDPERAHAVLWDLHARGLRVAIDDFGTGYSSLSRLRHLPIDVLKIDRSFVSAVDTDPQGRHDRVGVHPARQGPRHDHAGRGHRNGRASGASSPNAAASWARASTSAVPCPPTS